MWDSHSGARSTNAKRLLPHAKRQPARDAADREQESRPLGCPRCRYAHGRPHPPPGHRASAYPRAHTARSCRAVARCIVPVSTLPRALTRAPTNADEERNGRHAGRHAGAQADLVDGSGSINHKREFLVGGDAEAKGVGAHHALHPESGCYRGARVGRSKLQRAGEETCMGRERCRNEILAENSPVNPREGNKGCHLPRRIPPSWPLSRNNRRSRSGSSFWQ
jgi:hypothetical protein